MLIQRQAILDLSFVPRCSLKSTEVYVSSFLLNLLS
jgi:hypothetical protein